MQRLKEENSRQWKEINRLREVLVSSKTLRHRFLSAFKRDVMKNADATDARLIAEGNELAHYGNASADAGLYIPSGGRDFGVYEYLYGLDPGIVQRIGESMVIPYNNPNSP
jgi:hypothetical protein